ncbi:MAG: ABC transporter permease [Anaerolineae bacterium]|nr:ABC transporter permease [Anaerolineae bacterium]
MSAKTPNRVVDLKTYSQQEEEQYVSESLWATALRRLRRDYLTLVAMLVILVMGILAVGAPFIAEQILHADPNRTNVTEQFLPPGTPGHPLGTDDLGRDHLARLLFAGRISLGIGFGSAILTMTIGLSIGIFTGYYGGITDDIVNWVITTMDSIPALFLLLIISSVLKPSPGALVLVLAIIGWTGVTRLVRGETLAMRNREFIVSARSIGASDWRIMFVHILPNLFSIVIVTLAINVGVLILTESGLSFLGVGVKPPTPTWGNMLTNAQSYFTRGAYLVVWPGLLITVTVLCLYVIGDGVRDAFDPKMRR